jgi:hypothetical protein
VEAGRDRGSEMKPAGLRARLGLSSIGRRGSITWPMPELGFPTVDPSDEKFNSRPVAPTDGTIRRVAPDDRVLCWQER